MTGRVKIIRKVTEIVDGRKKENVTVFYSCWCDVKSLGSNEKRTTLQDKIDNTIVFEVRNCKKMKEIRMNLKEFHVIYDGVEFEIYDASPKFIDNTKVLLKCRSSN